MKKTVYQQILKECKDKAKLIIVSKYRSEEQLMEYYHAGHRMFAENRVQELCAKKDHLPNDIEWHMIGHLQTNKVKYIVPFITMIHSIHSYSLIDEVEKQAAKIDRIIPVCIQFNLAKEVTKSGFAYEEWETVMHYVQTLKHINVIGIMVIGPNTDDIDKINNIFSLAKQLFKTIKKAYPQINELSMGMSHDYQLALNNGATMIRVGSILF